MSLYSCQACGSSNVMHEKRVKKYLTDKSCDENIALSILRSFPEVLNLTENQQNTPEFTDYTIMRISTIIRMLTFNGLASRFETDGRAYFKSTI